MAWGLGPAGRGARKMFGRPISEAGIVDASGVPEHQLRALEDQGILRRVDLEMEGRVRALEARVEVLESLLLEQLRSNAA